MKMIYCPHCDDIRKLHSKPVLCECRRSWGHYIDDLNAVYGGEAVPLGLANSTFNNALKNRPDNGLGERFCAFVIPVSCPTFIHDPYNPDSPQLRK